MHEHTPTEDHVGQRPSKAFLGVVDQADFPGA